MIMRERERGREGHLPPDIVGAAVCPTQVSIGVASTARPPVVGIVCCVERSSIDVCCRGGCG